MKSMNVPVLGRNSMLRLLILGSILGVSACSNSGSNNSSNNSGGNGNISSLQIITPKTIYSKSSTIDNGYVVINNLSANPVRNIHYSLTNLVGGGSGTTIDESSAASCATVAAYSQCNLKITVPAGAVAGSFGFSLEPV